MNASLNDPMYQALGTVARDERGHTCIVTLDAAGWATLALGHGSYVIVESADGDVAAGEVIFDPSRGRNVVRMDATLHVDRVIVRRPRLRSTTAAV
jgi:hypothetical protein